MVPSFSRILIRTLADIWSRVAYEYKQEAHALTMNPTGMACPFPRLCTDGKASDAEENSLISQTIPNAYFTYSASQAKTFSDVCTQ